MQTMSLYSSNPSVSSFLGQTILLFCFGVPCPFSDRTLLFSCMHSNTRCANTISIVTRSPNPKGSAYRLSNFGCWSLTLSKSIVTLAAVLDSLALHTQLFFYQFFQCFTFIQNPYWTYEAKALSLGQIWIMRLRLTFWYVFPPPRIQKLHSALRLFVSRRTSPRCILQ